MFRWFIKRKKCISDFERYITLIFCIITDIKNLDYLKKIYDFAEIMWKKEKREAGREEPTEGVNPAYGRNL